MSGTVLTRGVGVGFEMDGVVATGAMIMGSAIGPAGMACCSTVRRTRVGSTGVVGAGVEGMIICCCATGAAGVAWAELKLLQAFRRAWWLMRRHSW